MVEKGADVVLQVHYHKSGKPETDRTKVGLTASLDSARRLAQLLGIGKPRHQGMAYRMRAQLDASRAPAGTPGATIRIGTW